MELKDASPGEVVNFVYKQPHTGAPKRVLARVDSKRSLDETEILRLNRTSDYREHDPEFKRTGTLVTCTLPGGRGRNFYAERSESCRKPTMGPAMFLVQDAIARIAGW